MQKKDSSTFILDFLEEAFPNKLPLDKIDEYELGIVIGQQLLINQLKKKLNITKELEMEDK